MPLAFVCNLLGTLAASGVILYANSTLANGPSVRRLFGDKNNEHHVRVLSVLGGSAVVSTARADTPFPPILRR